jgi:FkbM family methyltransferase
VSPKLPPPSLVSAPDATAREIADARGTYYDHAVGFTPLLAVDTVAGLFLLDTHDAHMGRSLFSKSSRGELRVLRRALRILEDAGLAERARAGTFIDVGANIGTTTVPALYANGFTRALGLEPEPRNIHMLRINIAINGFTDQVQVLQVAASNTCGTGHLRVFPDRWGIHEIAAENGAESGSEEKVVEIELVTLDSLAEQSLYDADGTGLLWIDAEGHEGHILHGATRLVSEGTPVILEVQPSKLQGQGGLEFLRDAAEGHYTDFVDMRHVSGEPTSPRGVKYEIKPIDHFQALIDEYLELDHFTEALLLRR